MKKIILCIIISFFFSSQQFLYAQENASSMLIAAKNSYENAAYDEALTFVRQGITFLQADTSQLDSLSTATLYFYKGASEYYIQSFDVSIASYNTGISFCPTSDEGQNYKAELYYERAFSQFELGSYPDAYKSSKKAALVMETVKKPNYDYLLSIYADISGSAANLGFKEEAKNYLNKAKKLYIEHKNEISVAKNTASKPVLFAYKTIEILNNNDSFSENDITKIKEQVQELEKLKRRKKFNPSEKQMYAVSLNFLGDAYLRKDSVRISDCKQAHINLDKALQNIDRKTHNTNFYQFQFNKAKAYKLEKKHNKALKLMQTLLEQLPKNDARLSYFEAEKANILIALNRKEKVIHSLEKTIAAIHKGNTPLLKDYTNFAPSYDLNETGLLVEMADKVVKRYPKDPTVLSLAAKMYRLGLIQFENCYREETLNDKLTHYYQTAIGGMLRLKKLGFGHHNFNVERLLNTMETIENRLIWKQFQQNRLLNVASISDALLKEEQTFRKALVAAKKRKDTVAIFDYSTQLKHQLLKLKQQFPNITTFAFDDFDLKTVQASMHDSKVILKYKKINQELFVFKITKNTVDFYEIEQSKNVLSNIEQYYNRISTQQENKPLANSLFIKLLPFNSTIYTDFTIIPDDVLHYLPFETLVTNDAYFVEKATINYATHLVFAHHNSYSNQIVKNDDVILFTPKYNSSEFTKESIALRNDNYRLFGAERESKLLASIFPSTLFESILATKDNFIKYSPKARIIHLAMHANINNETPELSHLLFNENDSDSKMYIEELYGLHLNADLAVLSACNTGKGTIDKSKGMVSLNRAFTLAGVPSTLASLWEVPDKVTQEIMVDFYKNLRKGETKTTALRNAKINYLKNTDDENFQKPFYWAGFVLHGDSTPISLQEDSPNNFICIIAFILLLIIGFIVRSRLKTNTLKLF